MGRAPCCDKANVKKGPWSPEEDVKLKSYIEQHGTGNNWIALPQKIGLKRCGKSCRLRWLNYLRPNIKHGGFSEEEDRIICNLYISIGSRWSIIAAQLPGRTDNDIKNYWNTRLKKKLLGKYKHSKISSSNQDYSKNPNGLEDNSDHYSLSTSAIERLQLHMQLQGLEINPSLSFNNNPTLWPNKLHNFQENIILKSLQSMNEIKYPMNFNPLIHHHDHLSASSDQLASSSDGQKVIDHYHNENNNIFVRNPIDSTMMEQKISTFEAQEIDEFLNNNKAAVSCSVPHEGDQIGNINQFDGFNEMNINVSKESLIWWSNDGFGTRSSANTSNSWDSSSVLEQSDGMFQDYEVLLGYNL